MNLRLRLLLGTDRVHAIVLATLLAGTALAFGGAVWWARPAIAVLSFLAVLAVLVHQLLEGKVRVLKSPLAPLGLLALGLAAAQLAPLPAPIAGAISPRSRDLYALGVLPPLVRADDPGVELPEPMNIRSPVTVDRSATLRWLAGAMACLGVFWAVSQFADRLGRLYLVWGSLVAAFFLNTTIAVVQLVSRSGGLYGFLEPGKGSSWLPSVGDLLATPNATALRTLHAAPAGHPAWAAAWPDRPFLIGTLMGGPGAYLALGALGLPLALALALQLMAPRGSREALAARLGNSGGGSLLVLLCGLLVVSAVLVGLLAGPLLSLPFAVGLSLVGLPGARSTGLRWLAVGLTAAALVGLGVGVGLGVLWADVPGAGPPIAAPSLRASARVWSAAWRIVGDFPIVGTGLGSFASIYPSYKARDEAQTTALSSLLQWWVESGALGMALLLAGGLWCLWRIPGAVRSVGAADRSLVFGLIGAAAAFSLYSALHWSVELAAVALAASAVGGTWNRWLAGGTDLFVERA